MHPLPGSPADITGLLHRLTTGAAQGVDQIFPFIYDELRRLAGAYLRRERDDHTLEATALVHEVYLRLVDQTRCGWKCRAHFFAIAAQAMRRILVDHARRRGRKKRGGGRTLLPLERALAVSADMPSTDLLALDQALNDLARKHPDDARIVEMRFFAGLTSEEIAVVLGIGVRTVQRRWRYAQVWLYRRLTDGDPAPVEGAVPAGGSVP